ncbi:hypothetical protein [Ramlibacter sp.]|uniref:hypothetical protein n=1 Tax=Ramlibacter sp. TaxID=1917967 RepID=UPI001803A6E4|nr:hypothetical protein [Ramlibacter sp.]MBA2672729.1 hypothetical protein [Ramlibacter sp.]
MKLRLVLTAAFAMSICGCGGSAAEWVGVAKPAQGMDITGNTTGFADQLAHAGISVRSARCFPALPEQLPMPGGRVPESLTLLYSFSIAPADLDKALALGFTERSSTSGYVTEGVPCVTPPPIQPI